MELPYEHLQPMTQEHAKNKLYITMREIIDAITPQYAHIISAEFHYESINDSGDPPFTAIGTLTIDTLAPYYTKDLTTTYHRLLLTRTGWCNPPPNFHSHMTALSYQGQIVTLPVYQVNRSFGITSTRIITEDLRAIPERWDQDGAHGPLRACDITNEVMKKTIGTTMPTKTTPYKKSQ